MHDLKAIIFLLRRFGGRYWAVSVGLIILSILAGFSVSLQPLVLAPALNILESSEIAVATSFKDTTLNNLGPSLMHLLGFSPKNPLALITFVGFLYLGVAILSALLNFASYIVAIWLRTTISRDMMQALHRKIQSMPLAFFYQHRVGDLISRYNNDVAQTAYFVDSVIRGIIQSAVTAGLCFYILARTSVVLTLTVFAVGVIHMLVMNTLRRPVRLNMHRENVARGGMGAALQESLSGIRTIKSFAAEEFDFGRIRDTTEDVRHNMLWNAFFKHLEEPLRLSLNAAAIVVVLLVSFRAYIAGTLSISGFGLFLMLAQKTVEPTAQLALHLLAVSRMLGCASRVMDLFNAPNELPDGEEGIEIFNDKLEIEAVTFGYQTRKDLAVKDVTLTVRRGEMIALVGPSGGGKSTLADLVLRLHDPQMGRVLIDNRDVRDLQQASYRSIFGVVPQDCMLFNTSIRENILMGRLVDNEHLERAVELSNSAEFVAQLPDAIDTLVGDRGVMLSGGQRQRIAIARAIYGDPSILVLDEATSALDSDSEQQVQQAIENVVKGVTAIVIAHRLSTVRKADRIVVLDRGKIDAIGTHAELLQKSPVYQRLCKLQFGVKPTNERN
jgi:ATP-binding cassette, subfamily B, bacterial MsbA